MSDSQVTITPTISMNSSWKVFFAVTALAFNAGVIVYCIAWGNPANSLHTSALAWAYGSGTAILGGIGVGAIVPSLFPIGLKQ